MRNIQYEFLLLLIVKRATFATLLVCFVTFLPCFLLLAECVCVCDIPIDQYYTNVLAQMHGWCLAESACLRPVFIFRRFELPRENSICLAPADWEGSSKIHQGTRAVMCLQPGLAWPGINVYTCSHMYTHAETCTPNSLLAFLRHTLRSCVAEQ